ncbi:MAG TPA: aldose epimerase family protein, partial [Thermomicrobiales bacterium]|nr:aldose epimerase family protein [Thermomicrobiales bacterium]
FPGTLATTVTYRLTNTNELQIAYDATTDKPTVVTLTNHTYFNLGGEASGSILRHILTLHASHFTPTHVDAIPVGEHADVAGTPFDFRKPTAIGARVRSDHPQIQVGHGYDHNFVIDREQGAACALAPAAWVQDPKSGRTLSVHTTEPGVQFYTGNFLRGNQVGISGSIYRQSDGFALETEHFPDSPNQPDYPSTVLRPGEQYHSETVFAFGVS